MTTPPKDDEPAADPEPGSPPEPAAPKPRRDPVVVGFLVGIAAVAVAGVVAFKLSGTSSGSRAAQPAPGDATATPNPHAAPDEGHGGPSAEDGPEEKAAKSALERNPDDLEARLELARLRLDKQDYMSVWAETQEILKRSPGNPRAMTYQSQVRLAMGQPEIALELLKEAVKKEPTFLQAYIYLAEVHLRLGHDREADDVMAAAKRQYPKQAAWLDSGFSQMKAEVKRAGPPATDQAANPHAGPGSPGATNPHAGVPPGANPREGSTGASQAPPAAEIAELSGASGPTITGTLDLDPSLKGRVPAGAVVFITLRDAGARGGPPLAAKRVTATFPQPFEVGPADSMSGAPIPPSVLIEARVDADGDAASREPSDPVARRDEVKAGTTGVRLVLTPP